LTTTYNLHLKERWRKRRKGKKKRHLSFALKEKSDAPPTLFHKGIEGKERGERGGDFNLLPQGLKEKE